MKYEFTYVYDSIGRLIEQVQQAKNGRGNFNPDPTQKSLSKLIVKYAYNPDNKLSGEYAYDTTGRLRTQVSYNYNIGKANKFFFDSVGNKILSFEQYFDNSLNIYRTCNFWSSGDLNSCGNWKFEYNKNGRLKKKLLMESKLEVKYNYLPNGLLNSVENIGFNKTIERYTYDYWK